MRGVDDLARAGKILYAGLSDFPAWRVSRAVTLAEVRGSLPIAGVQLEYSLVERTAERELLPMAQALGLGTLPERIIGIPRRTKKMPAVINGGHSLATKAMAKRRAYSSFAPERSTISFHFL